MNALHDVLRTVCIKLLKHNTSYCASFQNYPLILNWNIRIFDKKDHVHLIWPTNWIGFLRKFDGMANVQYLLVRFDAEHTFDIRMAYTYIDVEIPVDDKLWKWNFFK